MDSALAPDSTWSITPAEKQEIARQIGRNVWAISGGRVHALRDGISMPCGSGYRVHVRLTPGDDYIVERVYVRNGREFPHGSRERVYADEVAEAAYYASCYRSYSADEWVQQR